MFRRDYLLRQIEQLAALFRRMMQLKAEQKYDDAFREADSAYDQVFAANKQLLKYADSATLATIIGEAELIHAVARLSRLEGELFEAKGDPAMAAQRYRRALELHLEGGGSEDLSELVARVGESTLDPRYRAKLAARR